MKATELMIGDWILYGDKPVKVLQLRENGKYDWVKPIPLTPEILEKNGWKLRRGYPTEYEFIRSDYVHCYYDVKHKHCVIEVWEEICVDILLDTVHTLQHALRLCGLDELATNFKI